jgi:hypothetical protein
MGRGAMSTPGFATRRFTADFGVEFVLWRDGVRLQPVARAFNINGNDFLPPSEFEAGFQPSMERGMGRGSLCD